ncbi:MAG: glycosyltransferase family 4 protein [Deltaproteobacteria bacterium]|nr:glycosyltransferase family 4 protein [Deltaproteobacteria bacterium]
MTDNMVWMIMPTGTTHGWGMCGKYLALEMSQLTKVRFITDNIESERENNRVHYERLSEIHTHLEHIGSLLGSQGLYKLGEPLLQAIQSADLKPWHIKARAPRVVGYTFFEKTTLKEEDIFRAREYFDWMVAGSTWCEEILKEHGFARSSTIIQGVDADRFHSGYSEKRRCMDHFVLFSGGKIEFRKGQDLVIRAFKVLQDKHDDVLLVNAWYNMWDESVMTMQMSPYITFDMPNGDYFHAINSLMHANGIDPQKVVTLPPQPHTQMPALYRDTDCGLFPNRCEGGTNLVLMEYMACGKPAIASLSSGHKDILREDNCIPIRSMGKIAIKDAEGKVIREWDNPGIDEVIDRLEWAYQNRDSLKKIGRAAGRSMETMTWERAARGFMDLMTE